MTTTEMNVTGGMVLDEPPRPSPSAVCVGCELRNGGDLIG